MSFRLTYASMFDPPASMHEAFEAALSHLRRQLGATHGLYLQGQDEPHRPTQRLLSPIDTRLELGRFAIAGPEDVERAMQAARAAYPAWRATPPAARVALLRRVAELMQQRVYAIAAALALEVGKTRMEALGETQETVDFFRQYADDFERARDFDVPLPDDPLAGVRATNRSVLRPHGVWLVIAPFNYPLALMGGPTAAALVTGNVVVAKGSPHTPWGGRLLADCLRDAGVPPGVFQWLHGDTHELGTALAAHPDVAGITFTGSVAVGRALLAQCAGGRWPRPCIAEMGGKNPCIVTEHADLDAAAAGIVRSAYGLSGQKCSALSRLYVHRRVADALIERVQAQTAALSVGDPTERRHGMGPVNNAAARARFEHSLQQLRQGGATLLAGGTQLLEGMYAHGHFVAPTLVEAPSAHPLWRQELFLPLLMLQRVDSRAQAMQLANDSEVGLSAGFYGAADEVAWFHEHIEAGVTYANRAQGATTGAWPGYQPFGGWKGSGSSGKAIASFYYLPLYLREQSRTVVIT
ncbi:MAG: 1-pyrroline-5-carboxylate dehydrogenase [Rubrivivax sp. SCN 71-131]|nr:MAG: 1-pyrroline-5-carboxylate dehydrogenase [Rubrivivax sp. SCN 71-131]